MDRGRLLYGWGCRQARAGWRSGRRAVSDFRRAECLRSAAAISYFGLLSFIPFMLMTLSALGFILVFLGDGPDRQEEFIHSLVVAAGKYIPLFQEDLAQRLRELVQMREALGIVGGIALVLTSSLVFGALEDGLNRIFEVSRSRHLVKSKLVFVGFVATLGLFAVLAHYASAIADALVGAAGGRPLHEYAESSLLLSKAAAYVGTALLFVALMKYFLRRRLPLLRLWAGATFFFFLFEAARLLFSLYVAYLARFSALYGSLATFMIAIIWTFYTALIFLFSACLVHALGQPFGEGKAS